MKKLILVFVVAFAFSTMAMASDIAFYVGQWNTDGWYDATQFKDVATIIAQTGHLFKDIQQFDDKQLNEFGAWVDKNTNDDEMDIIWLNGCTPSVLYPNPNQQPDGSRAEKWLDGGNMIINVGDWFAYVTYEGGPRGGAGRGGDNGGSGAANILDLPSGIIVSADGTQMRVTPTGKKYLPSLNDPAKTDRPVVLTVVQAPWEVAAIFASLGGTDNAAAEARADPVVIHNTQTGGYVAFINQASGGPAGWVRDRGLTCAEFIGNWVNTVIGLRGPEFAAELNPKDKAVDVPRDVVLSWTPGVYADKHDVYLGTNFNDVNEASRTNPRGVLVSQGQAANTYDSVGVLDFSQTYYWRIDEVNAPPDLTIFKGEVWQFTVEPVAYPIAGTSITATASSQFNANTGPQNTINGSGLTANDLHSTAETGIWLSSMTGPQPTWIQYEFNRVHKLYQMWVWNNNTSIEPVVGFGFKDVTIEYSTNGTDWTVLTNVPQFARAPGTPGYAYNTTVELSGVVAKYVKLTANSNWGGILPQYGLSEVRFFYVPVVAREPNPASGLTDVTVDNVTLSWRAGREAAKHNVYFSDSNQAVIDGTAPATTVSQASYGPLSFDLGKAYYWRVDEVNEAKTPATWQGDVWDFTAQEYLIVDDFEDYNDFEPDRIFDTWIDGWSEPTKNGSQVGYANPPFAEKTIVHGGYQSMPLHYDNTTASYSEATANIAKLAIGNDWTKYGITALSLWFRGDPNNAAERMYIKLNGAKVAYDGAAANLALMSWQLWNIDLTSFVGVNLRNVTEIKIGFERSGAVGGKGKVYFDDIRLYRSAPAPINEWRITAGSDDAEEKVVARSMDLTSSDLELGYEGAMAPAALQIVGCRWVGIPVPKGATITEAWVQFSADDIDNDYHAPDVSLIIEGELSANPATFGSAAGNISSRPKTTAKVVWDIPRWMTVHAKGPQERTADISPIIQEIVNQGGWAGNAIVLMFRDNPAKPSKGCREAESFNGDAAEAPLLHIIYR